MGHVGAETAAHDAIPRRVIHGVKFCLQDVRDVIQDTLLFESIVGAVNCMLLHLFGHVSELDDSVLGVCLIASNHSRLGLYLYHYSNY